MIKPINKLIFFLLSYLYFYLSKFCPLIMSYILLIVRSKNIVNKNEVFEHIVNVVPAIKSLSSVIKRNKRRKIRHEIFVSFKN